MAETVNISALANKISDKIFKWLKWEVRLAKDLNFPCEIDKHGKQTHPADTVFYYKNPYTNNTVYVHTDLKSYKDKTITTSNIRDSLKSLAKSIECAIVSQEWQTHFAHNNNYDIYGMLFIYNHDGEFKKDFYKDILEKIDIEKLDIPTGQLIAIFEPKTIQYLLNICDDLAEQGRKRKCYEPEDYEFYYPNLTTVRTHALDAYPATIESILSSFMIVRFSKNHANDYIIYYKESGNSTEEFIYLIDTLATHQLLDGEKQITIVLNTVDNANSLSIFDSAKRLYAEKWGMRADNDIFKNIITQPLTIKYHYFNPLNERIANEQD